MGNQEQLKEITIHLKVYGLAINYENNEKDYAGVRIALTVPNYVKQEEVEKCLDMKWFADFFQTDEENIKVISKEEYELNYASE